MTASAPTLSPRALNRALLARQLLLERTTMPIPEAIEQVGGLQTQDAPSGYVGLWTRLSDFPRAALTEALTDRFRELTGREGRAVEREREALEAFHA